MENASYHYVVVFDKQIYFALMEWGDESNKKWFKIAQPTPHLINFLCFKYCKVVQLKVKSVV